MNTNAPVVSALTELESVGASLCPTRNEESGSVGVNNKGRSQSTDRANAEADGLSWGVKFHLGRNMSDCGVVAPGKE